MRVYLFQIINLATTPWLHIYGYVANKIYCYKMQCNEEKNFAYAFEPPDKMKSYSSIFFSPPLHSHTHNVPIHRGEQYAISQKNTIYRHINLRTYINTYV